MTRVIIWQFLPEGGGLIGAAPNDPGRYRIRPHVDPGGHNPSTCADYYDPTPAGRGDLIGYFPSLTEAMNACEWDRQREQPPADIKAEVDASGLMAALERAGLEIERIKDAARKAGAK